MNPTAAAESLDEAWSGATCHCSPPVELTPVGDQLSDEETRMNNPRDVPCDVPFSISCYVCDCDSPDSMEEALAAGWTEIIFTPEGLGENFLGYCPEHRIEDDAATESSADA